MKEDEICRNCSYYHTDGIGNRAGQCRVKPPPAKQRYMKLWPIVDETDFCGKFKRQVGIDAQNEQNAEARHDG